MTTGTNAELFSAAMGGDDLAKFDDMDAGLAGAGAFSDEDVGEAEGLLEKVAETAAPAVETPTPVVSPAPVAQPNDAEPPAWFKSWLATQQKPAEAAPAAKVEEKPAPTPEDALAALVADPNKTISAEARRIAEEMFAPLVKQQRELVVMASHTRVTAAPGGAEKLTAAEAALEAAVKAGTLDQNKVAEALKNSADPYGDVVRWHDEQQQRARLEAMSKDPDGFLLQQLQEAAKDPAKREKILAAFGQAEPSPADVSQRAGNVTDLPPRDTKSGQFLPSLNAASSAKDHDEEPSDPGVVFQTAMRGPRR